MFSSRTILALAVALNVVTFFPTEVTSRKLKFSKKSRKPIEPQPEPEPEVESFRIIILNGERTFILPDATQLVLGPPSPPSSSLQGSQLVINGQVYDEDEVSLGSNGEIIDSGDIPPPTEGTVFTSYCIATKATNPTFIEQNLCEYNFCLPELGCLFLRSGGNFALNFADINADTPVVEAAILGGTGECAGKMGSAVITVVSKPLDNINNQDGYFGATVLQLDISSFDLRPRNLQPR